MSLTNLSDRYRALGRPDDALAPTEEAVALSRELAADNPAYLPDLAGALNNLGDSYRSLGREPETPRGEMGGMFAVDRGTTPSLPVFPPGGGRHRW